MTGGRCLACLPIVRPTRPTGRGGGGGGSSPFPPPFPPEWRPGGEVEVNWTAPEDPPRPADGSEAHTLAFDVAPLRGASDWEDNENKPYDHWKDEHNQAGTLAAVLLKLRQAGLPAAASHQFQHSPLSRRLGEHTDFRYDLRMIGRRTP